MDSRLWVPTSLWPRIRSSRFFLRLRGCYGIKDEVFAPIITRCTQRSVTRQLSNTDILTLALEYMLLMMPALVVLSHLKLISRSTARYLWWLPVRRQEPNCSFLLRVDNPQTTLAYENSS